MRKAAVASARISSELLRFRPLQAPIAGARLLAAKYRFGIDASSFIMLGMHDQRAEQWKDWLSYPRDLEPGLRTINWEHGGKRLTVDKLVTAERFARMGIPSAPLIGVIGRHTDAHPCDGMFPMARTVSEAADLLAASPNELFVKPADGWRGQGVMGPVRVGTRWDIDGRSLSDTELAAMLVEAAAPAGTLLQARVRSHEDMAPIGGRLGLGTVRINSALTTDGPEILFAFAKVMGSAGLVDNFSGGKFGNLLARVDKDRGTITQAFGRRPGQRYLMEPVTRHPVTGTQLPGFQLPVWPEALALVKRVSAACPEAPLIGADVALTDEGPLVIEIQSDWDANGAQLMIGQGLRPLLRDVVPRLAVSEAIRAKAARHMRIATTPASAEDVSLPVPRRQSRRM